MNERRGRTSRAWGAPRSFGIGLVALVVAGQLVDATGRWYLGRYTSRVEDMIASERPHLENRARLVLSDMPVDQNRTSEQIDDALVGATYNSANELVSTQPSGGIYMAGTVN